MNTSDRNRRVIPHAQKEGQREIPLRRGEPEAGDIYCDNHISTGKYTLLSLIPKNLFEQFHRVANIWFLVVSVCQLLPLQLSPTSSWATIAPLSLVLSVTLAKDAYLDYRRHRSDRETNNRPAQIWSEAKGQFETVPWKSLRVGNFLLLRTDEPIPADIMLMATSEADNLCFVETSSLDGENNLKIKGAVSEMAVLFEGTELDQSMKRIHKFDEAVLQAELPNNRLYVFDGSLKIKGHPRNISIDNHSIMLRGSMLKNTKWALGLVVFTGVDTKLMMNSKAPPLKRSNVERRVNRYLSIVFSVLFFVSILSAVISVLFDLTHPGQLEYFSGEHSNRTALNLITFLILYNGLVPISLYVTMDVIRVIQSWFIQWDLRMYYPTLDQATVVKSGDLNEDLGQIEYVFTDKTGTLTENQMEFKRCYIKGKVYGTLTGNVNGVISAVSHEKFKFYDGELYRDLQGERAEEVGDFLELLSLCHTVIPNISPDGAIMYQSASPDEEALVIAAHCFGYSFHSAKPNSYTLNVNNEMRTYQILGINEFTSERKRMSVVVQRSDCLDGRTVLYCKGADNVMLPLCDYGETEKDELENQLTEFARQGLRTLLVAKRVLTDEEKTEFERKYITAKNAMYERSERLMEVAAEFEINMTAVGITAIEDKVQIGVADTIAKLREAEVKVWVLTGDKQETAINIGYACRLLTKDMTVITVNCASVEETRFVLRRELGRNLAISGDMEEHRLRFESRRTPNPYAVPSNSPYSGNRSPIVTQLNLINFGNSNEVYSLKTDSLDLALVVDGSTLAFVFTDLQCMRLFSMLSLLCQSVICCRVSPMQKSQVVKLVKEHFAFKPVTLAIGDGANDVSMIQEAHVGVGMMGNEGMQAVNASDYALARFRYLLPLLFLHGRWNYRRISRVILYSFFKNFLLVLPMFIFSFWNQYSGTALYDSWLIMSYNTAFTALPIVVLGVLDQDLSVETLLNSPALYSNGIHSLQFNARIFLKWVLYAVIQSMLIFFTCVLPAWKAMDAHGHSESLDLLGTVAFYVVVETVTLVILMEMQSWTKLFFAITLVSLFAFYPFLVFYDYSGFPTASQIGILSAIFRYPTIVTSMLLTPLICLFIPAAIRYSQVLFSPALADKFMLIEKGCFSECGVRNYQITDRSHMLVRARQYHKDLSKAYISRQSGHVAGQENLADYSFSKRTLVFSNVHIERGYSRYIISKSVPFLRRMFWLIAGFNLVWTIVDLTTSSPTSMYISIRVILAAAFFITVLYIHTPWFIRYFEVSVLVFVVCGLAAKNVSDVVLETDSSMSTAIAPIIIFVLFNFSTYKLVLLNLVSLLVYLVRTAVFVAFRHDRIDFIIYLMNYVTLLIGILIVCCFVGFVVEKFKRTEYILRKKLESEFHRGQDILSNLLPGFVKEKVRQGIRYLVEDQGIVTIMFCDIYNFDKICATHEPLELTELLDGLFFLLDQLCDVHGVSKIETVNKTYMACGGLKDSEVGLTQELLAKSHALRIVELALDILKRLENVCLKNGEKLQVKIGINTGSVVAGVVGEHKPQFSLVGATVNLASRMCATSKHPDTIQISWNTYEFIKVCPGLVFMMDKVTAKGYGEVTTYYVEPANSIKVRTLKKKPTVLNRTTAEIINQQQPGTVDPLNDSQTPLIDSTKRTQVSPMSRKATIRPSLGGSEAERLSVASEEPIGNVGSDMEDLGLVGPVQWIMCSLRETPEQMAYRMSYIERDMLALRAGFWMTISIYCVLNSIYTLAFVLTGGQHGSVLFISLRLATNLAMVLMVLTIKKIYKSFAFPWLILGLYVTSSLVSVLTLFTVENAFRYVVVLEVMYTNVVINHISGLPFGFIVIASVCILVPWPVVALSALNDAGVVIETTAFLAFFTLLNGAASYMRESWDRKTYNLNKMSVREIENTERLLNQMMPRHVVHSLKEGRTPTERYNNVTLLFADIVGFTEWSKSKIPRQIIKMLSKLFSDFDHLCVTHNVYKVHTIGDCYVVLGFSSQDEEGRRDEIQESVSMINMALSMIKTIKRINREKNTDLNMRIGLHTGCITAGITGSNIVRYDIYGPDVDIANKMESSGMKGRLHVSETTKELVELGCPGRFRFDYDKDVLYQPMDLSVKTFFLTPLTPADEAD